MSKLNNFWYYAQRGGASYCWARTRYKLGIIDYDQFMLSRGNAQFNRYFEELPQSEFEHELRTQFDTILDNAEDCYTDNPETFNEKIQWLKVHDTTPLKSRLADKYQAREWIAERIGESYLVPTVGGPWQCGDEIDFNALPDQFALKATHGSGMNLIVRDKSKLDIARARRLADVWMSTLYGWKGMEAQYFSIPKRVYAEQYIEQENGDLVDYKIHCFNGVPKIVQVIGSRDFSNHSAFEAFFDTNWNRIDLMYHTYDDYVDPPAPSAYLDDLLAIATELSSDFIYVRVDLYEVSGNIYFGEMTFTPASGFGHWGGRYGLEASELIVKQAR